MFSMQNLCSLKLDCAKKIMKFNLFCIYIIKINNKLLVNKFSFFKLKCSTNISNKFQMNNYSSLIFKLYII